LLSHLRVLVSLPTLLPQLSHSLGLSYLFPHAQTAKESELTLHAPFFPTFLNFVFLALFSSALSSSPSSASQLLYFDLSCFHPDRSSTESQDLQVCKLLLVLSPFRSDQLTRPRRFRSCHLNPKLFLTPTIQFIESLLPKTRLRIAMSSNSTRMSPMECTRTGLLKSRWFRLISFRESMIGMKY